MLKIYPSSAEAAKQIKVTSICDACNGKKHTCGGFVWRKYEDSFDKYLPKDGQILHKFKFKEKKVYQYNKKKNLIHVYEDVYKITNFNIEKIMNCLNNKQYTAYGYYWRFKKDDFLFELKKKNNNKKKVAQYTKNGALIKVYSSIAEAKNETNCTNISLVCKGTRYESGNYVWRYIEDDFEKYNINKKCRSRKLLYDNKPVYQFNRIGEFIKSYISVYDIKEDLTANITKCLKNEIQYSKDKVYSWYKDGRDKNFEVSILQYTFDGMLVDSYTSYKDLKEKRPDLTDNNIQNIIKRINTNKKALGFLWTKQK